MKCKCHSRQRYEPERLWHKQKEKDAPVVAPMILNLLHL
jgi:hypothetical protein